MTRRMTESELNAWWESLCDGCAKCCSIGNNIACPSLDTTCNSCTVYEKRHDTEICLKVTPANVKHLHARGILPDSCAYVRYMNKKTPAKLTRWTGLEPARLIPYELCHPDIASKHKAAKAAWFKRDHSDQQQPDRPEDDASEPKSDSQSADQA